VIAAWLVVEMWRDRGDARDAIAGSANGTARASISVTDSFPARFDRFT
jgi:hypothetical protein